MKYHRNHQPTKEKQRIYKKNLDNVRAVHRTLAKVERELETPTERMQRQHIFFG
jgi:hypothetical protein